MTVIWEWRHPSDSVLFNFGIAWCCAASPDTYLVHLREPQSLQPLKPGLVTSRCGGSIAAAGACDNSTRSKHRSHSRCYLHHDDRFWGNKILTELWLGKSKGLWRTCRSHFSSTQLAMKLLQMLKFMTNTERVGSRPLNWHLSNT